jgi:hypothetical protein
MKIGHIRVTNLTSLKVHFTWWNPHYSTPTLTNEFVVTGWQWKGLAWDTCSYGQVIKMHVAMKYFKNQYITNIWTLFHMNMCTSFPWNTRVGTQHKCRVHSPPILKVETNLHLSRENNWFAWTCWCAPIMIIFYKLAYYSYLSILKKIDVSRISFVKFEMDTICHETLKMDNCNDDNILTCMFGNKRKNFSFVDSFIPYRSAWPKTQAKNYQNRQFLILICFHCWTNQHMTISPR